MHFVRCRSLGEKSLNGERKIAITFFMRTQGPTILFVYKVSLSAFYFCKHKILHTNVAHMHMQNCPHENPVYLTYPLMSLCRLILAPCSSSLPYVSINLGNLWPGGLVRGSSRNHQFLSLPEIVSLYYLDLNFFLEMEMERRGEGRRG